MAAFSHHHHHHHHQPVLLDAVYVGKANANANDRVPEFSQEPNKPTTMATCFSQFNPPDSLHQIPFDDVVGEKSCLQTGSKAAFSHNEASLTNKHSTDSSSLTDKTEMSDQVSPMEKKRKTRVGSVQSMGEREAKGKKKKKKKSNTSAVKNMAETKKIAEEAPTGYIHVRARRGQATDSHSLAERVRREKISERMKLLQSIVPGCDKVTGKALVLDEIINYVQSLQNQVEFLSMKLASITPMFYDFGMDLDALIMPTPERMNSMVSPLPNIQQSSPFTTAADSYPLLDIPFDHQVERPNMLPQENGEVLWDVDQQRQTLINQSAFITNNLCSFH